MINDKNFEIFRDDMRYLTNSEVRLKILHCLYENDCCVKEIVESTGLSYSSISGNIAQLEQKGYIKVNRDPEKKCYSVSNLTRLKLDNIFNLNSVLNVLTKYSDFFNNHKVSNDRLNCLKSLPMVTDCELIESTPTDVYKAIHVIEEAMVSTNSVELVCLYMHPNCEYIFSNWFDKEHRIRLIVPEEIGEVVMEHFMEYSANFDLDNTDFKVKLYKSEEAQIALVVSNDRITFGLCRPDGTFDHNYCILSREKEAINWGRRLFKEYESFRKGYMSISDILNQ